MGIPVIDGICGGAGMAGRPGGVAGAPGRLVGPMLDGGDDIPEGPDSPDAPGIVPACGPIPGGSPAGGMGMPGKPGIPAGPVSAAGFSRTKLWLCGNTSVSAPDCLSMMSIGFGQVVAVTSIRRCSGPTV